MKNKNIENLKNKLNNEGLEVIHLTTISPARLINILREHGNKIEDILIIKRR